MKKKKKSELDLGKCNRKPYFPFKLLKAVVADGHQFRLNKAAAQ